MTQPITLPGGDLRVEIAHALDAVVITRVDRDRMEARHAHTGQLLGAASRSRHPQADQVGWLIEVDRAAPEVIIAPGAAEMVLLWLAGRLAARLDGAR